MKKKIFIVIAIVIAVPLVTALFIPNHYSVSRAVVVSQPKEKVFSFLRYLKNQDHFNKWVKMDPEMKKSFRGTDGTIGSVYAWDGEKSGKGEQEIIRIDEGKTVAVVLRFEKPFKSKGSAELRTSEENQSATRVEWSMTGESPYPFNFMNLFMNKLLGADLDESLQDLKQVLEKEGQLAEEK